MAFLRIGANAAASAMGDAQVAATRDAFATFWNPAGLAASPGRTAAISHRIWIGNLRMYDLTAGLPLGSRSSAGVLITASDSGDLEARDMPGEPFGTFRAQPSAGHLGMEIGLAEYRVPAQQGLLWVCALPVHQNPPPASQ